MLKYETFVNIISVCLKNPPEGIIQLITNHYTFLPPPKMMNYRYPFWAPLIMCNCDIHKYANELIYIKSTLTWRKTPQLHFGTILTIVSPKLGTILRNLHFHVLIFMIGRLTWKRNQYTFCVCFGSNISSIIALRCPLPAFMCFLYRIRLVQSLNEYTFIINFLQFLMISLIFISMQMS